MQRQDKERLFARWLDDELNQNEQAEFEQLCRQDQDFSDRVATMGRFESMSQQFEELEVPEWNRQNTIVPQTNHGQQSSTSWWHWSGLPLISLATSMAAIFMVVTNMQINMSDQGLLISFADNYSEKQIQDMLDQRIQNYEQNNNQQLAMYNKQLQQQQQQFSTQLADYVLTSNRSERKEDFAELIKFVNQQRNDDQTYYASQLNRLEENIAGQLPLEQWGKSSSTNPMNIDE